MLGDPFHRLFTSAISDVPSLGQVFLIGLQEPSVLVNVAESYNQLGSLLAMVLRT